MRVEHEQARSSFFGAKVVRQGGVGAELLPAQAPGTSPVRLQPISAELLARQGNEEELSVQAVKELITPPRPYRIGAGDILGIAVWSHPELNLPMLPVSGTSADAGTVPAGYTVSEEGTVQFAFVGTVKVGGMTPDEARDVLTTLSSKYLKDPQITVRVQAFRSRKIYLDGEFRLPGQVIINDIPMTLAEAISRGGGLSPAADSGRMQIIRQERRLDFSLQAILDRGINPARIMLNEGDTLRVPSREDSKVYVLGEVGRPAGVVPMRNGVLSLHQALGEVGGVSAATSDPRHIYVVRNRGVNASPDIFHLDARSPVTLALADNFQLKPRDLVYVDAAPLALWNRVISLILPSSGLTTQAVDTLNSVRQ